MLRYVFSPVVQCLNAVLRVRSITGMNHPGEMNHIQDGYDLWPDEYAILGAHLTVHIVRHSIGHTAHPVIVSHDLF